MLSLRGICEAKTRADAAQPHGQGFEALLLPQRPIETIADERSRHPGQMESAAVGEPEGRGIKTAAGVIERCLLGVALRKNRRQAAMEAERPAPVVDGESSRVIAT